MNVSTLPLPDFLEKIVFGWIKNDLERMMIEIQVKSGQTGNINLPLALCVLAYIEYLGGFLRGSGGDFKPNVKKYIEKCFRYPDEYKPRIGILEKLFRDGLVHEYFARGGISRDGKRPALRLRDGIVILDVETLTKDFLESLEEYKKVLTPTSYERRMGQAIKDYNDRFQQVQPEIVTLPLEINPPSSSISGASLSPVQLGNSALFR